MTSLNIEGYDFFRVEKEIEDLSPATKLLVCGPDSDLNQEFKRFTGRSALEKIDVFLWSRGNPEYWISGKYLTHKIGLGKRSGRTISLFFWQWLKPEFIKIRPS